MRARIRASIEAEVEAWDCDGMAIGGRMGGCSVEWRGTMSMGAGEEWPCDWKRAGPIPVLEDREFCVGTYISRAAVPYRAKVESRGVRGAERESDTGKGTCGPWG